MLRKLKKMSVRLTIAMRAYGAGGQSKTVKRTITIKPPKTRKS